MALNSLRKQLQPVGTNLSVLRLDGIDWKALKFPNEESYRGGWKDSRPEGEGRYTWADGSTYEGAWHAGLKHGWGKYCWPNGACYQGEWRDGYMQGYGTFESPDGARYVGGWRANLKHGIGRKVYANGDSYEGLWRDGKAEGPGRYVWHNGNQYDGEWRAGRMHGQGTLKWVTGERYDGEWQEGQEGGVGVFTWRDGSTYEGFWEGGKKCGVGVFRPPPHVPGALLGSDPAARPPARGGGDGEEPPQSPLGSPTAADAPLDSPAASGAHRRRDFMALESTLSSGGGGGGPVNSLVVGSGGAPGAAGEGLVFVCAYDAGRLVHEEALSTLDLELIFGPASKAVAKGTRRRLRRGRKRQVRLGETIYKGHRSYDLMLNLQLGIRFSITTLSKLPPPGIIGEEHYAEKVWLKFPREGSEVTPPHPSADFKWKDYCPTAFQRLRTALGVDPSQYILSICGDQALREMPSPGKSGSVFFISHDDQYMIKTMHKEEIKLLLSMLPKYVRHVERNHETLLTRFYGVHRVKPSHGRKVRFVVMNNVFRTDLDLHWKFDLKGSTYGRTTGPKPGASAIRKDLDLDCAFLTDVRTRERVAGQLAADCSFLEDIHVMDYSLLLGVHCRGGDAAAAGGMAAGETSGGSPINTDKEDGDMYRSADEGRRRIAAVQLEEGEGESEDEEAYAELGGSNGGGALGPLVSTSGRSSSLPSARDLAWRGQRRAPGHHGGVLVGATSDSDTDVTRSMHSLIIMQEQADSPRIESRSPSFLSKGLAGWKSFTARRPSEPQLAPALHPGQTQQPPSSAQITPRVQPSMMPTPRLGLAAAPPPPVLAAASSKQLHLQSAGSGFAMALRAAAEVSAAADVVAAADGAPPSPAAAAAAARAPLADAVAPGAAAAAQKKEGEQEEGEDDQGGITWRSDAVQLPEQLLLPDGTPASPTGTDGADAAGAVVTARTRGSSAAPALDAILEAPGSGRSAEDGAGEGEVADAAAGQQAAATPPGGRLSRLGSSAAGAAWSPAGSDSVVSTPASSLAGTPTAAAAHRGLPLPGSVPRIDLQQRTPPSQAALQPQRESGDWAAQAQGQNDSGALASEQRGAASPRDAPPGSDAGGTPTSGQRRRTMAHAAEFGRSGSLASAPATARSPLPTPPTAAAQQHQHRLATVGVLGERSLAGASPRDSRSRSRSVEPGGLMRTISAPPMPGHLSGGGEEAQRSASRDAPWRHGRGQSLLGGQPAAVVGREASVLDLTSPEAVALQTRITTALSHKVTDRLVQDLLKLARYRMVGAVAQSPSARFARMPTTVLAARHMRRTSSASGGGGGGRETGGHGSSVDDELAPAGSAYASGDEMVLTGGSPPPGGVPEPPPRLGQGLPAVAVGAAAAQQPVLLYFGIIDFLQEYNMRKMLEHSFKAVVQDGRAISVVEPRTYAKRFLRFMETVFPPPAQQQSGQQQQQQQAPQQHDR